MLRREGSLYSLAGVDQCGSGEAILKTPELSFSYA